MDEGQATAAAAWDEVGRRLAAGQRPGDPEWEQGECCEWCSEPAPPERPLVEYDDGLGEGLSWVCQRCYDDARRVDVPGIDS